MKSTEGTDALIALEDDAPEALFARLPGTDLPLWPLLRWPVARAMAIKELDAVNVPVRLTRAQLAVRALDAALPHRHSSRRVPRHRPALFVVPGARITASDTGTKDQLVGDHAASLGDDAVIVRDIPLSPWTPARDRPDLTRTLSLDDAVLRSELAARFRPPSAGALAEAQRISGDLIDRLDYPLEEDERRSAIRALLIRFRRLAAMRSAYERILDRVEPRILFVQGAAYGDRMPLLVAAHRRGIHVAEHQHGFIGPSHGAYNFGAAMSSGELRQSLPDTLLTFGEFWNRQVAAPFERVAVGKPPLNDLRTAAAPWDDRERLVIIVAGVYEHDKTAAAALRVREALPPDWRLLFRAHPSERATFAERYPSVAAHAGIEVDGEPDALLSLVRARAVVGVASTTLYESLALGCQVIVRDNPRFTDLYIDRAVFPLVVDDGEELTRVVAEMAAGAIPRMTAAEIDEIWAPDSVERFTAFVERF
jgi:hypothetical protein